MADNEGFPPTEPGLPNEPATEPVETGLPQSLPPHANGTPPPSGPKRAWHAFRGWPYWVQAIAWVVVGVIIAGLGSSAPDTELTADPTPTSARTTYQCADGKTQDSPCPEPTTTKAPTTTTEPPTTEAPTTTEPPPPPANPEDTFISAIRLLPDFDLDGNGDAAKRQQWIADARAVCSSIKETGSDDKAMADMSDKYGLFEGPFFVGAAQSAFCPEPGGSQ